MALIFIVEDNESIRGAVVSYLKLYNHKTIEFVRASGVVDAVKMKNPDILILDIMLPDGDGFQLAKRIREQSEVPILFLTAKTSESDRVTGLEIGADDYMTKPFSPKELVLRVNAILRRTKKTSETIPPGQGVSGFKLDNSKLKIDEQSHRAFINDMEIPLTAAEWKILAYLVQNHGLVISRECILGECLDYMADGSERTVDTHVKNIRRKLGDSGWIETVREYGYRFAGSPG